MVYYYRQYYSYMFYYICIWLLLSKDITMRHDCNSCDISEVGECFQCPNPVFVGTCISISTNTFIQKGTFNRRVDYRAICKNTKIKMFSPINWNTMAFYLTRILRVIFSCHWKYNKWGQYSWAANPWFFANVANASKVFFSAVLTPPGA